ncbi:MAG: sugar transferase [Gemmataceae bacterium]|nr:sugar transferase [Gemmataceae bacterium]MCI0743361.1 sugar transferase [Gemmataceae bacterium]
MIAHSETSFRHVLHSPKAPSKSLLAAPRRQTWYAPVKILADCCLAAVFLALSAPLLVLVALAVKLTSRGPVFYSQTRLGRHGRPYRIYKIRTMYHNCELKSGICWSTKGDPRVTPFGRFLRATHLDELPQLWNILRGDMSLVGPRPERPEFVPELEKAMPRYSERLRVRPGLTGLAQVQLPADTDLESVRRKLAHDLHYVEHHTVWLDFRILASTALRVLGIPFHIGRELFFLPGGKRVELAYNRSISDITTETIQGSSISLPTAIAAAPAVATVTELQPA